MKKNYSIFCFMIYFFILLLVLYLNPPLIEYLYPLNVHNDYNIDNMTDCYDTNNNDILDTLNNECTEYLYKDTSLSDNDSINSKINTLLQKIGSLNNTSCPNGKDFIDYKNQQVYYLQSQIDFLKKIKTAEDSGSYPNIDYLTSYKCPIHTIRAVCKTS